MASPVRGRHVTKRNHTYALETRTDHVEIAIEIGSVLCQIPIQEWRFGGQIPDQLPAKPGNIKLIGSWSKDNGDDNDVKKAIVTYHAFIFLYFFAVSLRFRRESA